MFTDSVQFANLLLAHMQLSDRDWENALTTQVKSARDPDFAQSFNQNVEPWNRAMQKTVWEARRFKKANNILKVHELRKKFLFQGNMLIEALKTTVLDDREVDFSTTLDKKLEPFTSSLQDIWNRCMEATL